MKSETRNPNLEIQMGLLTTAAPACAIGLDIGGTKIAGGLVLFPEGAVVARQQIPTVPGRGGEAVLTDAVQLAASLLAHAPTHGRKLAGIGVGICELVDLEGNVTSDNCVRWRGVPVRERFSRLAPAVIEADSRAAALGEAMFGAGRPFHSFFYVTIGTGIGSAFVIGGVPHAGARGSTGTLASSPLPCVRCEGEPQSTIEAFAAGPALLERYNARRPGVARKTEDVLSAANSGDGDAIAVITSAASAVGAVIGLMVNVLDPEAVIIGGSVGLAGGLYWETLAASTRRHIWSYTHRELSILPAGLGGDAGVIGAATTAWRQAFLVS